MLMHIIIIIEFLSYLDILSGLVTGTLSLIKSQAAVRPSRVSTTRGALPCTVPPVWLVTATLSLIKSQAAVRP